MVNSACDFESTSPAVAPPFPSSGSRGSAPPQPAMNQVAVVMHAMRAIAFCTIHLPPSLRMVADRQIVSRRRVAYASAIKLRGFCTNCCACLRAQLAYSSGTWVTRGGRLYEGATCPLGRGGSAACFDARCHRREDRRRVRSPKGSGVRLPDGLRQQRDDCGSCTMGSRSTRGRNSGSGLRAGCAGHAHPAGRIHPCRRRGSSCFPWGNRRAPC